MGARNPPKSPLFDKCATSAIKNIKSKCCWINDFSKEVSVNSLGKYFEKYQSDGSSHNYTFSEKYKICVPLKTGISITAEIRIQIEAQAGVIASDITNARQKLETAINLYWNEEFDLEINDPRCGKKDFSIEYRVIWVTSNSHYTMKLYSSYGRENVQGSIINVDTATTEWVYAHEFAHCFGVPDEYAYTLNTEKVRYYKPDGTLDIVISAPPRKRPTASDATIMSTVQNTTILKRHAWNIAIEVQELLTNKLGRAIQCTIK